MSRQYHCLALKLDDSDRLLDLAIPDTAWNIFFRREFAKLAIAKYELNLIFEGIFYFLKKALKF
ncbi:hypothetical protein H6F44_16140 [Pseudanabaena sp. FACHB-1277]|uniref:Uncharacterized protein n=1 Tax=Pseudanabaena cinerea FACHB-1277 TaxID=2949581 RepID=A0A926Z7B4_9CYAN|nr:hypothetical protein [Pseudanabaena cinerea FACHB-1277]